jgi:hypothetical protein
MAVCQLGLQPCDEGPEFVDRLRTVACLSGDYSEANGGLAELEHRAEVGVVGIADAQRVGR